MSGSGTDAPRPGRRDAAPELSLVATLLLIAIDPANGRLVKRRRRRFRKALATTHGVSGPGGATRARRAAIRELRAAGFIERSVLPGCYPVVPGSGAYQPFGRLRRCIVEQSFERQRDIQLFVLLAWTGVLARRLDRSERKSAQRRLKALLAPPAATDTALDPIPAIPAAIGEVAYREEMDLLQEMVGDLLSGDTVTFDIAAATGGAHLAWDELLEALIQSRKAAVLVSIE